MEPAMDRRKATSAKADIEETESMVNNYRISGLVRIHSLDMVHLTDIYIRISSTETQAENIGKTSLHLFQKVSQYVSLKSNHIWWAGGWWTVTR